jgi:hypothetical protein
VAGMDITNNDKFIVLLIYLYINGLLHLISRVCANDHYFYTKSWKKWARWWVTLHQKIFQPMGKMDQKICQPMFAEPGLVVQGKDILVYFQMPQA